MADKNLLTTILRERLGFEGTVVADYFGIRFLERLHRIAEDGTAAASLALDAGVDVELPTMDTFGALLLEGLHSGRISEELVNRAALRVLTKKISIGLLDTDWTPLANDPMAMLGCYSFPAHVGSKHPDVALGDRAGLFGRGTSGGGCDATDLQLSGVQAELLAELLATETPVAQVTRPTQRLIGFARVELEPNESARVAITLVPTRELEGVV